MLDKIFVRAMERRKMLQTTKSNGYRIITAISLPKTNDKLLPTSKGDKMMYMFKLRINLQG